MIERHFAQAQERVLGGEYRLSMQRKMVAALQQNGSETAEAKRLLASFEELQTMHVAHRDRLEQELCELA